MDFGDQLSDDSEDYYNDFNNITNEDRVFLRKLFKFNDLFLNDDKSDSESSCSFFEIDTPPDLYCDESMSSSDSEMEAIREFLRNRQDDEILDMNKCFRKLRENCEDCKADASNCVNDEKKREVKSFNNPFRLEQLALSASIQNTLSLEEDADYREVFETEYFKLLRFIVKNTTAGNILLQFVEYTEPLTPRHFTVYTAKRWFEGLDSLYLEYREYEANLKVCCICCCILKKRIIYTQCARHTFLNKQNFHSTLGNNLHCCNGVKKNDCPYFIDDYIHNIVF